MKLNLYLSIQKNNIDREQLDKAINDHTELVLLNLGSYIGRNFCSKRIYSKNNKFKCISIEKFNNVLYSDIHQNLMEMEKEYNKIKIEDTILNIKFFTEEIKN